MNNLKRPALACATVGIMAATLECVKLALAFIPNVEAVTLFCALFGYCFGALGVAAALVFVFVEPLIYGLGTWVAAYIVYWPTLAAVFALLGKFLRRGVRLRLPEEGASADGSTLAEVKPLTRKGEAVKVIILTATAVVMTFLFGVLTSLIEVGLFSGSFDNFFYRFAIYYARGVWFYLVQILTNLLIFPLLFLPLSRLIEKIRPRG